MGAQHLSAGWLQMGAILLPKPGSKAVVIGGRERPELGISFDVDQTDFLRHVDEVTRLSPEL